MAGFLKRLLPKRFRKEGVVIPVVRLHGPIMSGGSQFRPTLNLAATAQVLEKAFSFKDAPAVEKVRIKFRPGLPGGAGGSERPICGKKRRRRLCGVGTGLLH